MRICTFNSNHLPSSLSCPPRTQWSVIQGNECYSIPLSSSLHLLLHFLSISLVLGRADPGSQLPHSNQFGIEVWICRQCKNELETFVDLKYSLFMTYERISLPPKKVFPNSELKNTTSADISLLVVTSHPCAISSGLLLNFRGMLEPNSHQHPHLPGLKQCSWLDSKLLTSFCVNHNVTYTLR